MAPISLFLAAGLGVFLLLLWSRPSESSPFDSSGEGGGSNEAPTPAGFSWALFAEAPPLEAASPEAPLETWAPSAGPPPAALMLVGRAGTLPSWEQEIIEEIAAERGVDSACLCCRMAVRRRPTTEGKPPGPPEVSALAKIVTGARRARSRAPRPGGTPTNSSASSRRAM